MSQLVYTKLLLNGSPILATSNYSISLYQAMASHHTLKITCPTDAIENPLGNFADKAKEFIGGRIALQVGIAGKVMNQLTQPQLKFMGVVTNVSINKFDGADGSITIIAHSPTILLSHGLDSQSYENQPLDGIIKDATKEYPKDLIKIKASPLYKKTIPYTVQYKEDDFSFMQRLAARYGEWFYYDGEQIQFGIVSGNGPELLYGQNLHHFNFAMQTRPQNHTFMAYDAQQATMHNASMQDFQKRIPNPYINHVTNISKKLYAKQPQSIYNHSLLQNGSSELEDVTKLKAGKALNTIIFTGNSDVPEVALGSAINVKGLKAGFTGQKEFYGKYTITEVTHTINSSGEYENQFSGIPSGIKVPPYYDEDAVPFCEEQYAVVKDNNDPLGMSRIRVQFPWQIANNQLTPWIRVTTPYAGSGKGMHILPELEEEVLVGFEGGSAEKPVVIGTMFNGKGTSGHGGAGNYMKGLQTAAGQRMLMNDQDGSLYLQDNGNATMKFDGAGNANTNVASTNVINVGGKKDAPPQSILKMDAGGNIILDGKTSITFQVGGNKIVIDGSGISGTVSKGDISFSADTGTFTIKSQGTMDLSTDADIKISSQTATIVSSANMAISGSDVEINKG